MSSGGNSNLHEKKGIRAEAKNILVTAGSQEAIELLARVLLDPGDIVYVENPTYLGALQSFNVYSPELIGVKKIILSLAKLVEDNPEISSVDINPIFVYEDRCVAIDVKILLAHDYHGLKKH